MNLQYSCTYACMICSYNNYCTASHSENPSSSLLSDTNETRLSSHSDLQSSGRGMTLIVHNYTSGKNN